MKFRAWGYGYGVWGFHFFSSGKWCRFGLQVFEIVTELFRVMIQGLRESGVMNFRRFEVYDSKAGAVRICRRDGEGYSSWSGLGWDLWFGNPDLYILPHVLYACTCIIAPLHLIYVRFLVQVLFSSTCLSCIRILFGHTLYSLYMYDTARTYIIQPVYV